MFHRQRGTLAHLEGGIKRFLRGTRAAGTPHPVRPRRGAARGDYGTLVYMSSPPTGEFAPRPAPGVANPPLPLVPGARTALAIALAGLTIANCCLAAGADSSQATSQGGAGPPAALTVGQVTDLGFENVQVDSLGGTLRVGFENRRYRHSADCVGTLERAAGGRVQAVERRLGLASAAISVTGPAEHPRFHVTYPSDPAFPGPPRGPSFQRTPASVDLMLRPLFGYELGRLTAPVQTQLQLEPFVRYNPWPGARVTGSVIIPVQNDFDPSDLHPDVDQFRPGLATLEQFAWIPRFALVSATAGIFADNRYGFSAGAARPLADGALLLDSQFDITGFLAFPPEGVTYSSVSQKSWFGGVTWYLPFLDVAMRVRAGQFLYGDRGTNVEIRRSLGDFDFALFALQAGGLSVKGVRLSMPVPPMTRATNHPVRVQPVEQFPISYRTDATPVGILVGSVASREDFLRQLSAPALDANAYRYRRALGVEPPKADPHVPLPWINATGMTGFIFTPWADVLPDRTISLDYTHVPAKWAYSGRGVYVNQAYSMALGVLPRVELGLRFTRLPGLHGPFPDEDNEITTDTDHMASGRLVLLTPTWRRPGLAIGAEDVEGTRRFHSTYAVAGMPLEISHVQSRFSLGYAPSVFTAARHVLEGGFGALEVSPWRAVAVRMEYDTEKWNVGVGVALPFGLRLRAAALNLETLSAGAGWTHAL